MTAHCLPHSLFCFILFFLFLFFSGFFDFLFCSVFISCVLVWCDFPNTEWKVSSCGVVNKTTWKYHICIKYIIPVRCMVGMAGACRCIVCIWYLVYVLCVRYRIILLTWWRARSKSMAFGVISLWISWIIWATER